MGQTFVDLNQFSVNLIFWVQARTEQLEPNLNLFWKFQVWPELTCELDTPLESSGPLKKFNLKLQLWNFDVHYSGFKSGLGFDRTVPVYFRSDQKY